jgi:hypothetical protein
MEKNVTISRPLINEIILAISLFYSTKHNLLCRLSDCWAHAQLSHIGPYPILGHPTIHANWTFTYIHFATILILLVIQCTVAKRPDNDAANLRSEQVMHICTLCNGSKFNERLLSVVYSKADTNLVLCQASGIHICKVFSLRIPCTYLCTYTACICTHLCPYTVCILYHMCRDHVTCT